MSATKLRVIAETSPFMMSYVITTEQNNCIIIDGGRIEDIPSLREQGSGRGFSDAEGL